jgi:hypothetical protein
MARFETADCEKTQAPIGLGELKRAREYDLCADACTPGRQMSSEEVVAEFFKYHAPNETTIPKYAAINQAAKNFAEVILANCPPGADRSDAIRKIREARMTANAAIALNGLSLY